MVVEVVPGRLQGHVRAPGSKSHTIRALIIATLAEGRSTIFNALDSKDISSCISVCRLFGAQIEHIIDQKGEAALQVTGAGGSITAASDVLDVGNSGTTLRLSTAVAALASGWSVISGDKQTRSRPIEPLLGALRDLGAEAYTTRGNANPPCVVRGPLVGGHTSIDCPTSQYLSSLLIVAPLSRNGVEIEVGLLNETPYVELTLQWLSRQGIELQRKGYVYFNIPGNQRYRSFSTAVGGDFSAAAALFCAAAVSGSQISVSGLNLSDPQGDKEILAILGAMGCSHTVEGDTITFQGATELHGGDFDLNATPDTLPVLAATACFANGTTRIFNVPQARIKETDRIVTMAAELSKLGANIEQLDDGLIIRPSAPLQGDTVESHGDHRVAMAMAVAGLGAQGRTSIADSECVAVGYPGFFEAIERLRVSEAVGRKSWRAATGIRTPAEGWEANRIAGLIVEAGRQAVRLQHNNQAVLKHDLSIVTNADREVEAYLQSELEDSRNGIHFIGEESVDRYSADYYRRALSGTSWVVDPIDGTLPYAHGLPTWGVSIALMHNGSVSEGALFLPAIGLLLVTFGDRILYAQLGNDPDHWAQWQLQPLVRSEWNEGGGAVRSYAIIGVPQDLVRRGIHRERHVAQALGSCVYCLAYYVLGSFSGCITIVKLWDIAGSLPFLRNMGTIMRLNTGERVGMEISPQLYNLDLADGDPDIAGFDRKQSWRLRGCLCVAPTEMACNALIESVGSA